MPMGTRHRLEGLLLNSKRGLVLQIDDGGVWALDHDRHAVKLVGLRVVVDPAQLRASTEFTFTKSNPNRLCVTSKPASLARGSSQPLPSRNKL